MEPSITLISNRLPVVVKRIHGKLVFSPCIGGLANGLRSYTTNKFSRWIGWPGITSDELDERDKREIIETLKEYNCYPVFLSQLQIDGFYNGYSNRILWPLFHEQSVASSALAAEASYLKAYYEVNEAYAAAVLSLGERGQPTWIHDYQLMLLPELFRSAQPDNRIGFFLHIPFPRAENFSFLPESKELIRGLLGADLIGFHTKEYARNFLESARIVSAGKITDETLLVDGREVRIADFPMGIDYTKYRKIANSLKVKRELVKLRAKYGRRTIILTVDRLDPSKGLVERAEAYGEFLRQNPTLHGKVVMVMLVVPSRTEIAEYQKLKEKLEGLIRKIIYEFGNKLWTPIDYLYNGVPPEQVIPLYRRADIAFIAPLRDGMNLVAKEYLASQSKRRGVLILSQTAGAAEELPDAVIVDPHDQASLVRGLTQAVYMGENSWRKRFDKMQRHLRRSTVQNWASDFMGALRATVTTTPNRTFKLTESRQHAVASEFSNAKRRLVLLDYDGTLAPFISRPDAAIPSEKLQSILRELSNHANTDVVIISGRHKSDLENWFGILPVSLVAEHGAFYRSAKSEHWQRNFTTDQPWKSPVKNILEKFSFRTAGSFVEEKETAIVWHFRSSQTTKAKKNMVLMRANMSSLAEKYNLQIQAGKKILEIRSAGIDKGLAAKHWLAQKPDFVLAIGDDATDEDTFRAISSSAYSVKIGSGRTAARFRIPDVKANLKFLSLLADTKLQLNLFNGPYFQSHRPAVRFRQARPAPAIRPSHASR